MAIKYGYKEGRGTPAKLSAQQVGVELMRIKKKNDGVLTPRAVVDQSKPKGSLLHNAVGWSLSDSELADEARLQRARMIINVIIEEREWRSQTVHVPAFINTRPVHKDDSIEEIAVRQYNTVEEVLSDADKLKQARNDLLERLVYYRNLYRTINDPQIQEIWGLVDEIVMASAGH